MFRPLTVLLASTATLVTLLAAPAQAQRADDVVGGNTAALDGTLRKGCHRYYFAYVVQVPTEDWTLEVSIVDRRGDAVASFAYIGPIDPKTQTSSFACAVPPPSPAGSRSGRSSTGTTTRRSPSRPTCRSRSSGWLVPEGRRHRRRCDRGGHRNCQHQADGRREASARPPPRSPRH